MMMKRHTVVMVFAALFAVALVSCTRDEEPKSEDLSSAENRLADPVYRAQIDAALKERGNLMRGRAMVVEEMEKMIDDMKAQMPGATDEAIKAELEKNPVWNDLYKQCENANAAIEAQAARSREMIRQRISK